MSVWFIYIRPSFVPTLGRNFEGRSLNVNSLRSLTFKWGMTGIDW